MTFGLPFAWGWVVVATLENRASDKLGYFMANKQRGGRTKYPFVLAANAIASFKIRYPTP